MPASSAPNAERHVPLAVNDVDVEGVYVCGGWAFTESSDQLGDGFVGALRFANDRTVWLILHPSRQTKLYGG